MKQVLRLLSGIALLSMVGCGIKNIDKPSPGYVYMWEKSGADFTEVGKALLECGMPTPHDVDPENKKVSINGWATIHACMVQSGFRYKNERGGMVWKS